MNRRKLVAVYKGVRDYCGPYVVGTFRVPFTNYCLFVDFTVASYPRRVGPPPPGVFTVPNTFSFRVGKLEVLLWPFKDNNLCSHEEWVS